MSRQSKQGLGFMFHPGANTSCCRVSRPSWSSAALPLVLAQGEDVVLWVTPLLPVALPPPGGNGLAGGRHPPSDKHRFFFFWETFSPTSHSSSFLSSSVSFPLWGFTVPFSWLAHPSFPCDSPAGAQQSCRQRTCRGKQGTRWVMLLPVEPLLRDVPGLPHFCLNPYPRLLAWKSPSLVTLHGVKIIEVHFSVLKGFGNNYPSVVESNGNSVSRFVVICTPVIIITE